MSETKGLEKPNSVESIAALVEKNRLWAETLYQKFFLGHISKDQYISITARSLTVPQIQTLNLREVNELIIQKANTDEKTGVGSYVYLNQRIQRAITEGKPFAILTVDADHFKKINDTYGHPAGDMVLYQLAQSIHSQVRGEAGVESHPGSQPDTVAQFVGRQGGEEFGVILDGVSSIDQLVKISERIRSFVSSSPLRILDNNRREADVNLTVSIGGTIFSPGEDKGQLERRVDAALYEAKEQRNRVIIH